VTGAAARLLRLDDAGRIAPGLPADLAMGSGNGGSPWDTIVHARRTDVKLVMIGGRPLVGDASFGEVFTATRTRADAAVVDGRPSLLAAPIARRLRHSAVGEPGLEIAP